MYKYISNIAIKTIVLFICIATLVACQNPVDTIGVDKCIGIDCQNGGVCVLGECDCTSGYYGDNCENKANALYIGNWDVVQEVKTSTDTTRKGEKQSYRITISEDASGATVLRVTGMYGFADNNTLVRIGTKIGNQEINGTTIETEVPADRSSFTFNRNQTIGNSIQLVKGEGTIDGTGQQLSGTLYTRHIDTAIGTIEEEVMFTADYAN